MTRLRHAIRGGLICAACFSSGMAPAQEARARVSLFAVVVPSCGLGTPDLGQLDLQDLTGSDGRLDTSKTGSAVLVSAVISDAWCNTPHSLALRAQPMRLTRSLSYMQPNYMAREVTYDATLVGWPVDLTRRPLTDDAVSVQLASPYAAPATGLRLTISRLQTLSANKVEQAGLLLEAGSYRGTVIVTLTPVN